MLHVRRVVPALVAGLLWALPLDAQQPTGAVVGQVTDSLTQRRLSGVEVSIAGTASRGITDQDGHYLLTDVPVGLHIVQTALIGYGRVQKPVNVTAGGTATVDFALRPQAALLEPVVVTGYGTQRREAITGSVSTIEATSANKGVITNVDQMIQGRAAGVQITQNNGEPGAGMQVLIRGGSSISATNGPLYVIDGVPINNVATEPGSCDGCTGGTPPLPRNPLNLLNPSDIASITVLKDASATAIYGSRAANGVILVETKQGRRGTGGPTIEYDGYASTSTAARGLDVLSGSEYRQFVQQQVAAGSLDSAHLGQLGPANTNWENAVTRSAITHNHNLSFTGGNEGTRYRASLNYMKQEGVTLSSALERIQGRLSANHSDLNDRLRLGLNVTTSRENNTYLPYENSGGFEGGVFQNVAIFNPTQPVTVTDSTGTHFYETGSTSVRNPVALADQLINIGQTTRTLGNVSADFDVMTGLTARVNVAVDHASGQRQEYYPNANPVGVALGGGEARQQDLENTTQTLQTYLTLQRPVGGANLDIVGGYEYNKFKSNYVLAQGIGYSSDALTFNNLGGGKTLLSSSNGSDSKLVSFFTRANVGFKNDRYNLTGVLRYDGSSVFAVGHKWALFPAISGSWHLSQESFLAGGLFSDLRLRLGYGLQGNPSIGPYGSLVTYGCSNDYTYPWGDSPTTGCAPTSAGNPNLKWEQTSQINGGLDFGLMDNRLSGSVDVYYKKTKDLLLTINVPQPAPAPDQIQNVGRLRNIGVEASLDAVALSKPGLIWRAGLTFTAERNKVLDLGPFSYIPSGYLSGQGQTNQVSERIIPGFPLGTIYGPVYVGVDANGKQLFRCTSATVGCANGQTTNGLGPDPADYAVLGNANPNFTLGVHSELNWGRFNASFLIRAVVGQDVVNNTALVYSTKGNALQDKNFLRSALSDPIGLHEPAIFSSRWVENASFVRLQNVTIGYDLNLPVLTRSARSAQIYVSADNLLLLTGYSGLDPEVYTTAGLATRGLDYLVYPRPRTVTGGLRLTF
jgi:TonB-dependent starch-binding outer membrane protein SusC